MVNNNVVMRHNSFGLYGVRLQSCDRR